MDTTSRSERLLIELRTGTQSSVGGALRCLPSVLCLIAAGIWLVRPAVGPWPLILVALALVARRLTTHARVLSTPFDRPLLLFVLAAALGAWNAYSQQAGWNRFWLIIAGITVYIGIVYAPVEVEFRGSKRISPVRAFLIILPAAISVYSLLTTDWMQWAQKLPWLNPWRSWIIMLRPAFSGFALHPNVVGGVLAALIPLQLAALLSVKRSGTQTLLGALCLGLSVLRTFHECVARGLAGLGHRAGCLGSLVAQRAGWESKEGPFRSAIATCPVGRRAVRRGCDALRCGLRDAVPRPDARSGRAVGPLAQQPGSGTGLPAFRSWSGQLRDALFELCTAGTRGLPDACPQPASGCMAGARPVGTTRLRVAAGRCGANGSVNVTLAERRVRITGGHPAARTVGRRVLWVRWSGSRAVVRAVCAVGQAGDDARSFRSAASIHESGETYMRYPSFAVRALC